MYSSGKKEQAFLWKQSTKETLKTRKQNFEIWNPATYGIRNPRMWNPESTDIKFGIHSVESGIQDSLGLPYMGRDADTVEIEDMLCLKIAVVFWDACVMNMR